MSLSFALSLELLSLAAVLGLTSVTLAAPQDVGEPAPRPRAPVARDAQDEVAAPEPSAEPDETPAARREAPAARGRRVAPHARGDTGRDDDEERHARRFPGRRPPPPFARFGAGPGRGPRGRRPPPPGFGPDAPGAALGPRGRRMPPPPPPPPRGDDAARDGDVPRGPRDRDHARGPCAGHDRDDAPRTGAGRRDAPPRRVRPPRTSPERARPDRAPRTPTGPESV